MSGWLLPEGDYEEMNDGDNTYVLAINLIWRNPKNLPLSGQDIAMFWYSGKKYSQIIIVPKKDTIHNEYSLL